MTIDLLFLLFIVFFAVLGYIRGFLHQIMSLILVISIILFAKPLADWIKYSSGWKWFQHSSELLLFALVAFSFLLLSLGIHGLIVLIKRTPGLSPIDRWLGTGLGAFKGLVLVLLLGAIYYTLPDDSRSQFADLDRDAQKSVFMSMSKGMLSWESIPSFKALNEAKKKLDPEEIEMRIMDRADDILPDIKPMKKSERPLPWRSNE